MFTYYRPSHFRILQLSPFALSRMLIDALGCSVRSEIESWLHILLVTAVATGHNGKEALCVLLELHGHRGQRTNCDASQSFKGQTLAESMWQLSTAETGSERLWTLISGHIPGTCDKYGWDWFGKALDTNFRTYTWNMRQIRLRVVRKDFGH